MNLEAKDWITIIGWPVTFALGVLSAVLIYRFTRKQKILVWGIESENEVIPKQLSDTLEVPVILSIGPDKIDSLTAIRVRLTNNGNETIENTNVKIAGNRSSTVLSIRLIGDVGELRNHISYGRVANTCMVKFGFLNPGTGVEFEILLSGYVGNSINADCASPGLEFKRQDFQKLELTASILKEIVLRALPISIGRS